MPSYAPPPLPSFPYPPTQPFFIDYDPDFEYNGRQGIGTPFSGIEYHVAVGDEVKIELLAAANNVGQIVQISLLAEPGAPLGSRLTEQVYFDVSIFAYMCGCG